MLDIFHLIELTKVLLIVCYVPGTVLAYKHKTQK